MELALKVASSAVSWFYGALGMKELGERLRERRGTLRLPIDSWALISAGLCPMWVRGLNLDRRGAGVVASEPITVGARVFIRWPDLEVVGFADVRHCSTLSPGRYRIGLRFPKGLERDSSGAPYVKQMWRDAVPAWDGPAD